MAFLSEQVTRPAGSAPGETENPKCRKKGVLSWISETLDSLLQIPRHKTDGTATKLEPGLLALPLGLTPIIHL